MAKKGEKGSNSRNCFKPSKRLERLSHKYPAFSTFQFDAHWLAFKRYTDAIYIEPTVPVYSVRRTFAYNDRRLWNSHSRGCYECILPRPAISSQSPTSTRKFIHTRDHRGLLSNCRGKSYATREHCQVAKGRIIVKIFSFRVRTTCTDFFKLII